METKSIAFLAAVPVPELLEKHHYLEWKIRMQTYLRGQDLWEDIINDNENENADVAPAAVDVTLAAADVGPAAVDVTLAAAYVVPPAADVAPLAVDVAPAPIDVDVAPVPADVDVALAPADANDAPPVAPVLADIASLAPVDAALAPVDADFAPPAVDVALAPVDAVLAPVDIDFAPPAVDVALAPVDAALAPVDVAVALVDANVAPADAVAVVPPRDVANIHMRRNNMALHVIQISCGPDAFSKIRTKTSADTAWKTLKDWYLDTEKRASHEEKKKIADEIDNSYLNFADLYKAVLRGKLNAAKEFLDSQPEAVRKAITDKGETALHIAVTAGHAHIVQELVDQDGDGCTARMRKEDLGIEAGDGCTALMKALEYGRSELARYLYTRTPLMDLVPAEKDKKGAMLLTRAIYSRNLDLALDLIWRYPRLTYVLDDRGVSPFLALASLPHAFLSANRLGFCKQWIYDHCISIDQSARSTYETRLNISRHLVPTQSVPAKSIVRNLLGIKKLYEMKKIHIQSDELLSCMCKEIPTISQTRQLTRGGVYDAINRAVKNGIFEFVYTTVSMDPRFLEMEDTDSRNIFMLAVLYRHSKIFSLIYELHMKNTLTSHKDREDNNILHMAGRVEDSTRLNRSSGAALQMQRELQWFKEVERIVNPNIKENTNKDGLTPRQLFTKNHEDMMGKTEKWMKDTASSCTVVGALNVTIMFAAAFTIPGGNDQATGFPIFSKKKLFMLFIISDALSLFSSSTSVLMFLGILTSRYAEKDFLKSLPIKMIIGLSTLFLSIATMMIAFSAALLIMLHDQLPVAIPLICLIGVPAVIFLRIQFPILKDMIKSTFFPGIFKRKMELVFK